MVEGARLESVCAGNRTAGSNPALSARRGATVSKDTVVSLLDEKDSNTGSIIERWARLYAEPKKAKQSKKEAFLA